ncbi:MAG: acyltransferase [Clostridiales bacterium]|nr:acyltransferase [Clostridiales bacterium]
MNRITWIDYYKAISILLVVISHSHCFNFLYLWTCSFIMQAFFFESGFWLKSSGSISVRELASEVHRKFKRLMVPCYLWAIIFASFSIPSLTRIIYGSYPMLKAAHSYASPLWFLPVLFITIVLFFFCRFIFQKSFSIPIKLCTACCAFLVAGFLPKVEIGYPFGINVSIAAFGFLLMGNICFPYLQQIRRFLDGKENKLKICLLLVGTVVLGVGSYLLCRLNSQYVDHVLMGNAQYGNYWLFLIVSPIGILFTIALAFLLDLLPQGPIHSCMNYIGQNTFLNYVLNKPIIAGVKSVLEIIPVSIFIEQIIIIIAVLMVSCAVNELIKRYAPVLLGLYRQ